MASKAHRLPLKLDPGSVPPRGRGFGERTLWTETTRPGSPRGEWEEPGRGRGPGEGGIVSGAPSCICLLEVLAERALCSPAAGLEVSAAAAARRNTEFEEPRARWPRSQAGGGVPVEQHAERRPAP